jgi:hypothetical protein
MRTILATAIVLLAGCQPAARVTDFSGFPIGDCPEVHASPQPVTLDELVASPSAFEGALVRTTGYYRSGFEESALYPNPRVEAQDARGGVWLFGIDEALSGKRVQITGVFTSTIKGHLSMWPGSVCAVSTKELPPDAP